MQSNPEVDQPDRYNELSEIINVKPSLSRLFKSKCKDIETMSSYIKLSLLIGLTGSGKSSLANGLCGETKFRTSNSTESETSNVECLATTFFGKSEE